MNTPKTSSGLRRELVMLAIVLLVAAALRLPHLDADASVDLQRGFIYDEGEWLKNARQFVLFGHWRLDDYNPALYVAPLYSLGLAGVFAIAGVGLAQAHLLNALAGIITCLLVYWILRREAGPKAALVGGLIQATSSMAVLYDRAGFIEPLQVMVMTAAIGSAIRSLSRPAFGALAGVLIVVALFAKVSSAIGGLIIGAIYLISALRPALTEGGSTRRWAPFGWFAGAVAIAATIGFVAVVRPDLPAVLRELSDASAGILTVGGRSVRTIRTMIVPRLLGLEVNLFFAKNLALFAVAALALVGRLTRAERARWSPIEIAGWVWLIAGLGFMGVQHFQPHRRFLFLQPALALLGGWYLVNRIAWPDRALLAGRSGAVRLIGAGLVLGGTTGFFLGRPFGTRMMALVAQGGFHLSLSGTRTAMFGASALATAAAFWLLRRRFPEARRFVPIQVIVVLSMVIGAGEQVRYLLRPSYTLRASTRFLGALTRSWPVEEQRIYGGESNTLAVENSLLAFSGQLIAAESFARFRPTMVTITAHGAELLSDHWQEDGATDRFTRCRTFAILPRVDTLPRFRIGLYLRDDLVNRCPSGPVAPR